MKRHGTACYLTWPSRSCERMFGLTGLRRYIWTVGICGVQQVLMVSNDPGLRSCPSSNVGHDSVSSAQATLSGTRRYLPTKRRVNWCKLPLEWHKYARTNAGTHPRHLSCKVTSSLQSTGPPVVTDNLLNSHAYIHTYSFDLVFKINGSSERTYPYRPAAAYIPPSVASFSSSTMLSRLATDVLLSNRPEDHQKCKSKRGSAVKLPPQISHVQNGPHHIASLLPPFTSYLGTPKVVRDDTTQPSRTRQHQSSGCGKARSAVIQPW